MNDSGVDSALSSDLFVTGDRSESDGGSDQVNFKDSADAGSTELSEQVGAVSVKNSSSLESKHSFCEPESSTVFKKPKLDDNDKYEITGSGSNSEESKLESLHTPNEKSDADKSANGTVTGSGRLQLDLPLCTEGKSERTGPRRPIAEVFNELLKECELMPLRWLKRLEESEKFEELCPTRLESILQEAKCLEESLKKQKETLRQRVKALSETLQKP